MNLMLHLVLRTDGATNVHLSVPRPATCCDHRMVMLMVNRNGCTKCVECDRKATP